MPISKKMILSKRRQRRGGGLRITEDGIFAGGVCDQEHHDRANRVSGALHMWRTLENRKCLAKTRNGRIRVARIPRWSFKQFIAVKHLGGSGGAFEIGMWRGLATFKAMLKHKKTLTPKALEAALKKACSYTTGAGLMQLMGHRNDMRDEQFVQEDAIYQERVAREELEEG